MSVINKIVFALFINSIYFVLLTQIYVMGSENTKVNSKSKNKQEYIQDKDKIVLEKAFKTLNKITDSKAVNKLKNKLKKSVFNKLKKHSIVIDLPELKIPILEKYFKLDNMAFGINGNLYKKKPWKNLPDNLKVQNANGLHIYLTGESIIKIGDYAHKGAVLINLNQDLSSKSITMFSFEENDKLFEVMKFADVDFFKKYKLSGKNVFEITILLDENDEPKDIKIAALEQIAINHRYTQLSTIFDISEKGFVFKYIELNDNLTLQDLMPSLYGGKGFAFYDLKIYLPFEGAKEFGIKAKTKYFGVENDVYLFEYEKNHAIAIDVSAKGKERFNIAKLIKKARNIKLPAPALQKLETFGVAKGMVIISDAEFKLNKNSLKPGIAKDLILDIMGKKSKPLKLHNMTFVADYDTDLSGEFGKVFSKGLKGFKFGLSNNAKIEGYIDGIFDKKPFVAKLEFQEEEGDSFNLKNLALPNGFTSKTTGANLDQGLFLIIDESSVEMAVNSGFSLTIEKKDIGFDGSIGLIADEESIGVSLTGDIHDTIDNFVGIKHFQVNGGKINTIIYDTAVTSGLELDTSFMGRTMTMSGDLVFDDKGYPKGIGAKTDISKLDKDGWKLVNYSTIIGVPTFTASTVGAVAGGTVFGIVGGLVGNVMGDVAGGAAGVPFGGVGAAPGAVIGGLVSTALVGTAGVAIGTVGTGVIESAQGFALGAIGDAIIGNTKIGQKGMDILTKEEAFLFKADEAYLSFATPNAINPNLGINAAGINFNANNIVFFDSYKTNIVHDFTWVYTLGNKISKDIVKVGDIAKDIEKDFKKATKRFEDKLKAKEEELKQSGKRVDGNWKVEAKKEILKDFKFTNDELKKAEKYVKLYASTFQKVMAVIHYELGLVKKKPNFPYVLTKAEKKGIKELKNILNGIKLKDDKFGPIDIKEISVDTVPTFKVVGKAKLLKDETNVVIGFIDGQHLAFHSDLKTPLGVVDTQFKLKNLKTVEMAGQFKTNDKIQVWIENEVENKMNSLFKSGDKIFSKLNNDLKELKKESDKALKELRSFKSNEVKYIDNSKAVKKAQKELNEAKNIFNKYVNECKNHPAIPWVHCHKWHCSKGYKYPCRDLLPENIDKNVDEVVNLINKYFHHIENPNVKKQEYEHTKKSVESHTYNPELQKRNNKYISTNAAYKAKKAEKLSIGKYYSFKKNVMNNKKLIFTVNKVFLEGDYNPLKIEYLLKIDYSLNGKNYSNYFIYRPYDSDFNRAAISTLITKIVLAKINSNEFKKETKWFSSIVKKDLSNLIKGNKYKEYLSVINQNRYKKAIETNIEHLESFENSSSNIQNKNILMSDMMPGSRIFKNRYIAIAHSTLCLGVARNGIDVIQKNCKSKNIERWTTNVLLDNNKKPTGYVQLKTKGLCLKARSDNNKQPGDPLMLSQCNNIDTHEEWKIISKDGFFDKIINKHSQMCLHFDSINANPKSAYAVWAPCIEVDSQGFRDIKDVQRPEMHMVNDEIKAKSGQCISVHRDLDKHFIKTKYGHTVIKNPEHYRKNNGSGVYGLYAAECKEDTNSKFNYLELIDGYIKIIHTKTGWCVVPKHNKSDKLALKPCSKEDAMFWKPIAVKNGFLLKNYFKKECIDIKDNKLSLKRCNKKANEQIIDFVNKGKR
ncbi:ricin-type beta-trefoil lectin domain protein [Hydrogenimonas thermophila]|uniref:Ricin-type beta-trefoil lectin domain-containing protein n=1 Tax=Hydrogenimonas thermophila TaxID=223786 RepID=A0A1I5MHQ0_9BACT|nr:ricin-type beta-trefoil lectin domain protein [Hydrogenimonas thermophila]SFP08847.1 Ricin-type beta-trefoil lectin domain-containing protein [Hydrogenimonas thermophila]